MKKTIYQFSFIFLIIALFACKPTIDNSRNKISKAEIDIFALNASFDSVKAKQLISMYIDFADKFPNDSSASSYLFKASGMEVSLASYEKAISLLDRIITTYPKAKFLPECYFQKAFIYDDKLKDFKNASIFYNEVIQKYPTNDLANAAKASLQTIGIPAKDLVKAYEQQKAIKADTIR